MGRLADRVWRTIEATYGWALGLRVIGDPGTSILRLGLRRHWGRPLTLPDGTPIRRGDRLGELHFRSDIVSTLLAAAPGPVRGLAIYRARGLDGLIHLARAVETDPALKEVQAFFGETMLWNTIRRYGFWAVPVRGRARRWVVSAYQRLMVRHYSPAGWASLKRLRATESRVVWISRARLLRHYGPGTDPHRRLHPAPRRAEDPAILLARTSA